MILRAIRQLVLSQFFITTRSYMSQSRVIRDGATNTITMIPPDGTHSASVIIMHGLGDSADGFADVAEMFSARYYNFKHF